MILFIAIFLCFDDSLAQDAPVTVSASYKADYLYNMSGGIEVGGGYLGYGQMGLSVDFEALNLWKNGEFFIGGATTHGATPSASFIGDLQVADNIEAGEYVYLEQLWFRQNLGRFMLKIGLQDLNEHFVESSPASEYINSSFGINSVISTNMDAPIFPVMGLGVELNYSFNDKWHAQICAFDGQPADFEEDPHNLHWKINKDEGVLLLGEVHYTDDKNGVKVGGFHHSSNNKSGAYLLADRTLFENHRRDVVSFLHTAYLFNIGENDNYLNIALGANLNGVFSKEKRDVLGIATTNAFIKNNNLESAIECFYKYNLTDCLSLMGDIQYIINPFNGEVSLPNALVGIFRLCIEI
ncbi:MAG: carbohydrate porin [Candidatus Limimorpha sp.]